MCSVTEVIDIVAETLGWTAMACAMVYYLYQVFKPRKHDD